MRLGKDFSEEQKQDGLIFLPIHPNANTKGFVSVKNVRIISEIVKKISLRIKSKSRLNNSSNINNEYKKLN